MVLPKRYETLSQIAHPGGWVGSTAIATSSRRIGLEKTTRWDGNHVAPSGVQETHDVRGGTTRTTPR